jgi:uncharacterized HAD superfamily protein
MKKRGYKYGIDLDGVIINSEPMLVAYIENHIGEKFNPPSPRVFDFQCGFNYKFRPGELGGLVKNAILDEGLHYPICEYQRTMAALYSIEARYDLCFITARPKELADVTNKWLRDHLDGMDYELHLVENTPKIDVMKSLGIEVLIDDRLKTVLEVSQTHQVGLICRPWNSGRPYFNFRITRGRDLYSVYMNIENTEVEYIF